MSMHIGVSWSFFMGVSQQLHPAKLNPFLPKLLPVRRDHEFCQTAVPSFSAKLSCQSYKLSSAKLQASQFCSAKLPFLSCQAPISVLPSIHSCPFPGGGKAPQPNTPMSMHEIVCCEFWPVVCPLLCGGATKYLNSDSIHPLIWLFVILHPFANSFLISTLKQQKNWRKKTKHFCKFRYRNIWAFLPFVII